MTRYFYNATAGTCGHLYMAAVEEQEQLPDVIGLLSDLLSSDSVPVVRQGQGTGAEGDLGTRWSSGGPHASHTCTVSSSLMLPGRRGSSVL